MMRRLCTIGALTLIGTQIVACGTSDSISERSASGGSSSDDSGVDAPEGGGEEALGELPVVAVPQARRDRGAHPAATDASRSLLEPAYTANEQHTLAIDPDNAPIIALGDYSVEDSKATPHVLRWNGSSWEAMGGPVVVSSTGSTYITDLALDGDGLPVAALLSDNPASAGADSNVDMMRWTGTDWLRIGGGPLDRNVDQTAFGGALVVDEEGRATLVWNEINDTNGMDVYASQCQ